MQERSPKSLERTTRDLINEIRGFVNIFRLSMLTRRNRKALEKVRADTMLGTIDAIDRESRFSDDFSMLMANCPPEAIYDKSE
jgi:hypothetical protein